MEGDRIKKKLPFAVLLILSLFMAGIAGVSAAEVGTAQTHAVNNSTVQENTGIQTNDTCNENESVVTQTDENVSAVEDTGTDITDNSTNQTAIPAAAPSNSTSKNSTSTETNTKSAVSTAVNNIQNSTSTVNNTNTQNLKAAAGETKVASTSFTTSQINNAAARVKAYIEINHKLPNYVTIGTSKVQMSDFLRLLTANLLQINSGKKISITLKTVSNPSKASESVKSGTVTKSGYLDLAKRMNTFIASNGVLPNYATSSLGKLNCKSLIYMFSKVLTFYNTNSRLPNYVTVKPWSKVGTSDTSTSNPSTPVPASLQQYLKATTNCQVNNAQIQALAKSITSGKSSTYAKAAAIFNWVRDNIGYSFYYNTKYGAVGVLSSKTANCVDTSHILIALERAAGIPARYEHVKAQFSSGTWYGHVIAQVWVDNKWYYADASSSRNTFGVINNWNTATATVYGINASISF